MDIRPVRTIQEAKDAARLMRGLLDSNKVFQGDQKEGIGAQCQGAWYLDETPEVPPQYRPPDGDMLVAYLKGLAAGTVAAHHMEPGICELKSMYVYPEYRRMGVADGLCNEAIRIAHQQGCRLVRLSTGAHQVGARALYKRLGFTQIEPWVAEGADGFDYFELRIA